MRFKAVFLLPAICLGGCSTPQQMAEPPVLETPTYDLRSSNPVTHPSPLPLQSSIIVDWKVGDKVVKTSEGFRAWDVNRDGRFDMLEILSPSGMTTAWAYDFDGDGQVDLVQATEKAGIALLEGPASIPQADDASTLLKLAH